MCPNIRRERSEVTSFYFFFFISTFNQLTICMLHLIGQISSASRRLAGRRLPVCGLEILEFVDGWTVNFKKFLIRP